VTCRIGELKQHSCRFSALITSKSQSVLPDMVCHVNWSIRNLCCPGRKGVPMTTIKGWRIALLALAVLGSQSPEWLSAEDAATDATEKRVYVFNDADGVEFHCLAMGRGFTDDDMKDLAKHRRLRSIYFFGTNTTGKGLAHLSGLQDLLWIHFVATAANDDCTTYIARMKSLEQCKVIGLRDLGEATYDMEGDVLKRMLDSGISDEGAAAIAKNNQLQRVYLTGKNLSEKGVLKLLEMEKVKDLRISHTKVNGEIASAITKSGLQGFHAPYSELSPDFVRELQGNRTLRWLSLEETDLSDEMAQDLSKNRSLRHISMYGTKVTKKGFERLSNAMPFTDIKWEEPYVPSAGTDESPAPWQMKAALEELRYGMLGPPELRVEGSGQAEAKVWVAVTKAKTHRLIPDYEAMLPYLKYIEGLNAVLIHAPPTDESNLNPLLELKSLTILDLTKSECSDEYLVKLCRTSRFRNTISILCAAMIPQMGDTAVAEMSKLPSLKTLVIDSSSVTDHGIAELSKSDTIKDLGIEHCTRLTDKSLAILSNMPSLQRIHLRGTTFSSKSIEAFREKRSDVEVIGETKNDE